MEYVSVALGVVIVILLIILLVKTKKSGGKAGSSEDFDRLANNNEQNARKTQELIMVNGEVLKNSLNIYRDGVDKTMAKNTAEMDGFVKTVEYKLDRMRDDIGKNLADVKTSNAEQLEKIRNTVDEKLADTLDQRFKQSFSIVAQTLDTITKNFGEMKSLTTDVVDLKKVLTNVKTRGTWGEVSLDNLLSQLLTPEQYQRSFKIDKRGGDDKIVDFVIKMPGKEDKVYLPLDSKFPVADFERIISAENAEEHMAARRALAVRIKAEAASIHEKYVKPPITTDFAVMYLPTESLFAEVLQLPGLADEIQTKYRVTICSPTTLAAFLNCLQMGFKTVAIEKRSSEIWKLLAQFKKDFNTFTEILLKTERQLGMVTKSITEATGRTELIRKRLGKVETENEELIEGDMAEAFDEVAADTGEDDEV